MLVELRGPQGLGGLAAVLDRGRGQAERDPVGGLAVAHVAVGHRLGVGGGLEGVLHDRPLATEVGQPLPPLVQGTLGEGGGEQFVALVAVGQDRGGIDEALVVGQLRNADQGDGLGPVLPGLQAAEGHVAAVLGAVVADQRVAAGAPALRRRRPGDVHLQGEGETGAHRPQARAEERDVHGRGLAGALPVEQGAHDPAGDGHGPDGVAEGRGRGRGDVVLVGLLLAHGHPGPVPEGQGVIGALVGVGAPLALAGAPHVDDVRVVGPDVLDVDVQLGADRRHLVGEEDVAGRRQLAEDLEAVGGGEVEADALLAPVGVLEQDVDPAPEVHRAAGGEAAHGVAPLHVLDLDDLGPPVGEQGRRGGDEGVLGDLEDPYALHDCGHRCSRIDRQVTQMLDGVGPDRPAESAGSKKLT